MGPMGTSGQMFFFDSVYSRDEQNCRGFRWENFPAGLVTIGALIIRIGVPLKGSINGLV